MLRHLRTGGSLLLYPAGRIEADPALFGVAETRPADWSGSLELLARAVSPLTVVPAMVSGVLSPGILRHPLARLHRDGERRRWLAATLQFVGGRSDRLSTRVEFGTPHRVASASSELEVAHTLAIVRRHMEGLLDRFRPAGSRTSATPDWAASPDQLADPRREACHP
jgi:hypothetical protein